MIKGTCNPTIPTGTEHRVLVTDCLMNSAMWKEIWTFMQSKLRKLCTDSVACNCPFLFSFLCTKPCMKSSCHYFISGNITAVLRYAMNLRRNLKFRTFCELRNWRNKEVNSHLPLLNSKKATRKRRWSAPSQFAASQTDFCGCTKVLPRTLSHQAPLLTSLNISSSSILFNGPDCSEHPLSPTAHRGFITSWMFCPSLLHFYMKAPLYLNRRTRILINTHPQQEQGNPFCSSLWETLNRTLKDWHNKQLTNLLSIER